MGGSSVAQYVLFMAITRGRLCQRVSGEGCHCAPCEARDESGDRDRRGSSEGVNQSQDPRPEASKQVGARQKQGTLTTTPSAVSWGPWNATLNESAP